MERNVVAGRIVAIAETTDSGTRIVAHVICLCCEKHAVETETPALTRLAGTPEQFADVYVVSRRYCKISQIHSDRSRRLRRHEYVFVVGQLETVSVGPAVGGYLGTEFVARTYHKCGVVAVEELIAPSIGIHAETREFTPCGN